jgi:hypothetical protein
LFFPAKVKILLIEPLKQAVKSFLAKFNIKIGFLAGNMQRLVVTTTQAIGAGGAADVFSFYIKNYKQFSNDPEILLFIEFYCNNWSLSASQWSQDIFVMFVTGMKQGGTFLEIGGADGFTHSNTYSLEKHLGWRGTLVEPDPLQYKDLFISRAGNMLLNSAISPSGKEEVLRLRRVGQLSALEGHEGDDMHLQTRLSSSESIKVSGISLTRLLLEKSFDYFSLDVEGAELKILKSVDWESVIKPFAITVEYNFRKEDRSEIVKLLNEQGYQERFASHDWLRRGDIWMTLIIH